MKVSVLIPTYNRSYIIREAIESVMSQNYDNVEIIVIDDGSTDDTVKIVESFGEGKIRCLRHDRNFGCGRAYNTGILAATGELVAFLDSDDVWKADYLERQVAFLERHPEVDAVFSDTEIREWLSTTPSLIGLMKVFCKLLATRPKAEEYVLTRREMYLCLLEEVPIKPSACVMRKGIFEQVGVFNEVWPSGTDWDLFLRFSRSARFGYINHPLVVQRRTRDATHQKFREQDKLFLLNVLNVEKNRLHNDPEAFSAVNRGICLHYNSLAWTYLERNEWAAALGAYWRGFRETRRATLLRKMGSGLVRMAVRGVAGTYAKRVGTDDARIRGGISCMPRANQGPLIAEARTGGSGGGGINNGRTSPHHGQ